MTSFGSFLQNTARERGNSPFLIWAPFDAPSQTFTYSEFVTLVARCAGGLQRRGIQPGDRVLVHLENCPEMLIARFACSWLGAICVGTNAMAAGPEIEHFVSSSRAKAAITQPKFAGLLSRHAPHLDWIMVVASDGGHFDPQRVPASQDEFTALLADPIEARACDGLAPCSVMFTSGTTSRPKGVVWTHANMLWAGRLGAQQFALRADDVSLISLPLFHVVGLGWTVLPVIWSGGALLLQPRFSASRYWPTALEHRATIGTHVIFTTAALSTMETPERHHFRQWMVARGDPDIQAHVRVPSFVPAWGMTEMISCPIVGDPWHAPRKFALGKPSAAYDVKVVTDAGEPAAPGQAGHLLVRGQSGLSIFKEYDSNPAADAEAFDADGFFKTGDVVILHEDGHLQFSDRASDVIKVGGEGFSPTEVEAVVRKITGVTEVAVVGRPDQTYGQVGVAFVEVAPDAAPAIEDRILEACRAALARFKVPRDVVVVERLPRVGNAKISRAALRKQFQQNNR